MEDGWNQGNQMTSWFDVSAHDLHGERTNRPRRSATTGQMRLWACMWYTLTQQIMTSYEMAKIGAIELQPEPDCDEDA